MRIRATGLRSSVRRWPRSAGGVAYRSHSTRRFDSESLSVPLPDVYDAVHVSARVTPSK